jgi:hypothetical protein
LAKKADFCQALANSAAGRFRILPRFGKSGPFLPSLGKTDFRGKQAVFP